MRTLILAAALVALAHAARAQEPERRSSGPLRQSPEERLTKSATAKAPGATPTAPAPAVHPASPPSAAHPTTVATAPSRDAIVRAAFVAGVKSNPRVSPADESGWRTIARMTGLGQDELVRAYDAIYVVDFAYKFLLRRPVRAADSARVVTLVDGMRRGGRWEAAWREVAQSPESETVNGAWAPAPFDSPAEARARFGLSYAPTPQQCFGAIGDMCDGGVPAIFGAVQPRWSSYFTLPDGTRMGFVDVGVDVGSILYHNLCVADPKSQGCAGFLQLAGQLAANPSAKTSSAELIAVAVQIGIGMLRGSGPQTDALQADASAWNKAVWNVVDGRTWRQTYGPYPVDRDAHRARWYDDLRSAPAREAWMSPVPKDGSPAGPDQKLRYTGSETRASLRLTAPPGAHLDGRDGAFCRSHTFASVTTPLLKAPLGTCK